ncbi:DUF512 domain-containing protein [Tractidigestivibacter sp.]|uniref:DUF512 domain-containing protein n=1 Tax=Tractidigestivibacter sp. TaxID=2847320 RepID=UPI002A9132A9|nr:DUF512 domain-containing protein [Tractidigestivibacter sp.]MCI6274549.1 DUF512 domain-containing protein [Coriobacteriaceae bacterium]MDY5272422.1 DUF512 domain-containing protein [Tractidigestivibacter sp.]
MSRDRSDYASTRERSLGAWVQAVEEGGPAWEAGIEPGMRIDSVNGHELRDLIDWRWEADGASCELEVFDPTDGGTYGCELWREAGEDWGIDFTDVLFDGIRTCVNACQFCFMSMLPADARPSLSLRDDDYRLSFLQGNFVTLTNVTDEDAGRIVACRLEPMNVSIHAISPEVRRVLIGPHAQRGIDVLERLLAAGIEVHAQIVLCPGVNDGAELARTLDWVEARPSITSLAVVPLGYTRFSRRFSRSFSDDPEAARAVIGLIEPYQARSRRELGTTRFQLSDEFYVAASVDVPPAEAYDGYPQYYDGIGMLRSFLDDSAALARDHAADLAASEARLARRGSSVLVVCGEAAQGAISFLCELWSPSGRVRACPIRNDYFGGDVNVTGLIVSQDLLAQLPDDLSGSVVVLPEVMFNFDHVTLDGDTQGHIVAEIARRGGVAGVAGGGPAGIVSAVTQSLG